MTPPPLPPTPPPKKRITCITWDDGTETVLVKGFNNKRSSLNPVYFVDIENVWMICKEIENNLFKIFLDLLLHGTKTRCSQWCHLLKKEAT